MKISMAVLFALATFASSACAVDVERCHRECRKLVKEKARCVCICEDECEGLLPVNRDGAEAAKRDDLEPAKRDGAEPAKREKSSGSAPGTGKVCAKGA